MVYDTSLLLSVQVRTRLHSHLKYIFLILSSSNVRVLYTTTFEELTILGVFPAYYVFNGLLILLQILHYFWFYLICQVAISAFKAGKV